MQTISTQINFLKKYSKLSKYILAVVVFGLGSVSLLSSPISPVNAATTVGVSNTTVVPQGLVGYWTFDGKDMTSPTLARDISGKNFNASYTTTKSGLGKIGQAAYLPTNLSFVTVSATTTLNNMTEATYAFWFKGSAGQMLSKNTWSYGPTSGVFIQNFSDGVEFWTADYSGFLDNKWHHHVVTFNKSSASNNPKIYVDGNQINFVRLGNKAGSFSSDSGSSLYLAQNNTQGTLDDFRIYNRAITPTEVQTLYKAGGGSLTATAPSTSNAFGLSNGLAGYWPFDGKNMTNATATDISGNGYDGRLVNTTNAVSASIGKLGQALTFDGVNDYVLTGLTSHYNQTTISAWIYPRSLGEGNLGRIIDKRENGGAQTLYFAMNGSNRLLFGRVFSSQPNANWLSATNTLVLNAWNHVVVTYDETSTINDPEFYINGVLSSTTESLAPVGTPVTNTDRYIIGNRGDTSRTFDGKIDDLRIYNRIVTAAEIQSIYKNGQTVTAVNPTSNNATGLNSGLVGYWPFDGKYMTNTTVLDASGNGLTGTLTNMTRQSSATIGKIGQGLKFNGAGQYISLGTPASLDLRSAHSISVWVKTNVLNTTQTIFAAGTQGCCGTENLFSLNYNGGGGTYRPQYAHSAFTSLDAAPPDLKTNTWYHIVATWDGSATQKIYINGILSNSGALTGIGSFGNIANIGATDGGATSFNGTMDDLRVYSRELSTSDVKALYKLGN